VPRKQPRTYSLATLEAGRLLGDAVRAARLERRWTINELAERVGASYNTTHKVERGDLSVELGVAFEAAVLLGVPLFGDDPERRRIEGARLSDRLAVLPERARRPTRIDNDF
jgi:transcriptional regulator with XRE-family HTH domain